MTNKKNLEASNAFFACLVEEIHRRGMKVILDGVFNHCGSFNKWMDRERIYENQEGYEKGAFISQDSPYHTFFKFSENSQWPYNTQYDGWWGHDTLPKLNYEESQQLEEYIFRIARKWVSPPYNVDGWRLDVAADLGHSSQYNHQFWKPVPESGERGQSPGDYPGGALWRSCSVASGRPVGYSDELRRFYGAGHMFLAGVEKHSDEYCGDLLGNFESFYGAMSHHMSRFHYESLFVAMNELSNHDHSRFLTRTNHKVGRIGTVGAQMASEDIDTALMRLAVLIQMTWPGAPTIYYGDEAACAAGLIRTAAEPIRGDMKIRR